eukprot:jgi/Mesvir1/14667/Mv05333-RA.1
MPNVSALGHALGEVGDVAKAADSAKDATKAAEVAKELQAVQKAADASKTAGKAADSVSEAASKSLKERSVAFMKKYGVEASPELCEMQINICATIRSSMKTGTAPKRAKRTRPARRPRKHRVRADNESSGEAKSSGAAKSKHTGRIPRPPPGEARVASFTEMLDLSNDDIDKAFAREQEIHRLSGLFTKSALGKLPSSEIAKAQSKGKRDVHKLMLESTLFTDPKLASRRQKMSVRPAGAMRRLRMSRPSSSSSFSSPGDKGASLARIHSQRWWSITLATTWSQLSSPPDPSSSGRWYVLSAIAVARSEGWTSISGMGVLPVGSTK